MSSPYDFIAFQWVLLGFPASFRVASTEIPGEVVSPNVIAVIDAKAEIYRRDGPSRHSIAGLSVESDTDLFSDVYRVSLAFSLPVRA